MIRRLATGTPEPEGDGCLTAGAATRNLQPILDALLPRLPRSGTVLELASGTGQHIAALAAHRPDLAFHPTDMDAARRLAIDARCRGLPNVAEAGALDAVRPGWARAEAVEAVLVVNLLHLISDAELSVLLDEAVRTLTPGGLLALYGPFLREGRATSHGDACFDADLRAQDPAVGLKDVEVVETVLAALGLGVRTLGMPANNLMVLAARSDPVTI